VLLTPAHPSGEQVFQLRFFDVSGHWPAKTNLLAETYIYLLHVAQYGLCSTTWTPIVSYAFF